MRYCWKPLLALSVPLLADSSLTKVEATQNVQTQHQPCEHAKDVAAYQHKVIFPSNFVASGDNSLPSDKIDQRDILWAHKRDETRSIQQINSENWAHVAAREIQTVYVTASNVQVVTVTADGPPRANAAPTSDTDSSEEEDDENPDESGSESDEDQKNSSLGGHIDDDTDLEECLDHYRDPANITALIFTERTIHEGTPAEVGSYTTLYNVSNHWGVSDEHPEVEMRIYQAESCPPNATLNLWNIILDKKAKAGDASAAAAAYLPSCTELIKPEVRCTDEMSCTNSCALHVHHKNYLLIGLLSALGGMALTSLLGFAIGYCLRRRHRRQRSEKGIPAVPAVIIDSTPPNADGNVDVELEPARVAIPGTQSPTARSSLPQRIRRHVSTPLSLSHRKGLLSYFNVGNSVSPERDNDERNGAENASQESSKSDTLANENDGYTNREAPRLGVF